MSMVAKLIGLIVLTVVILLEMRVIPIVLRDFIEDFKVLIHTKDEEDEEYED